MATFSGFFESVKEQNVLLLSTYVTIWLEWILAKPGFTRIWIKGFGLSRTLWHA